MRTLITEISLLAGIIPDASVQWKAGKEMAELETLKHAWLLMENGKIASFGRHEDNTLPTADETINAQGGIVLPAFVDSHTHLVFAATREEEFVMRLKGHTYEEIAGAGGGILNSARKLRAMSEDQLFDEALPRLHGAIRSGTGVIEMKSGYGLTVEDEMKILRVVRRLKEHSPIPVKATFLGAHAVPAEYRNSRDAYVKLVTDEMIPRVAKEELADYCDVFCDTGFFTVEETDRILTAADAHGLRAKIHANELAVSGGVQVAVKHNALSVDHLERTTQVEIDCLKDSATMPVALPNCSFFLGIPFAPVRNMIDNGLPVCLASDFNPGTAPSFRISFVVSLACLKMNLLPEEAINATTINGAYALQMSSTHGSITVGKSANVILTQRSSSLSAIPYSFGHDLIRTVFINGLRF
jgi:imidazolonepropionase